LAVIVNLAGHFYTSSNAELTTIYSNLGNSNDFRDIGRGVKLKPTIMPRGRMSRLKTQGAGHARALLMAA
jgi:hypothetical protein